jgi:hypothetical protein
VLTSRRAVSQSPGRHFNGLHAESFTVELWLRASVTLAIATHEQ